MKSSRGTNPGDIDEASGKPSGREPSAADPDAWLELLRSAEAPPRLGNIGEYEIEGEVSRGAQGVVLRAKEPSTGRTVALKRLLGGAYSTTEARQRFAREIEAVARLRHPGIVTLYGTDVVDGAPVLAMEWIDGSTLLSWARPPAGRARPRRAILKTFAAICDAVQHAHAHGVLHRDLKPSNILIDAEGRPHLLDFGLAKLLDDDGAAALTQTSGFLGTPAYAAPEVLGRGARAADARSDEYSLGVILFELLTGERPFAASADPASRESTPRPSKHDPSIGRDLESILLKSLEGDPARRYQSVDALASDVRRFMSGQAVSAHPPSSWYELKKLVGRNRIASALVGVLLATSASYAIHARWQQRVLAGERESLSEEQLNAQNLLLLTMLQVKGAAMPGRRPVEFSSRDFLDSCAALLEQASPLAPIIRAQLHQTVADSYLHISALTESEVQFRKALALNPELPPADVVTGPFSIVGVGRVLLKQGRYGDAEPLLVEGCELLRPHAEEFPRAACVALDALGTLWTRMGREGEAVTLLAEAVALAEARPDWCSSTDVLTYKGNLAAALAEAGRRNEALALYEAVLEEAEIVGTEEVAAASLVNMSPLLAELRGRHEAITAAERGLELRRGVFESGHPKLAGAAITLANLLRARNEAGDSDRVYELSKEAYESTRVNPGPNSVEFARAARMLGAAHGRRHEDAEAEALFRESLEAYRALGLNSIEQIIYVREDLIETLIRGGGSDDLLALARAHHEDVAEWPQASDVDHGEALHYLASGEIAAGLVEDARGHWNEAIGLLGTAGSKGAKMLSLARAGLLALEEPALTDPTPPDTPDLAPPK